MADFSGRSRPMAIDEKIKQNSKHNLNCQRKRTNDSNGTDLDLAEKSKYFKPKPASERSSARAFNDSVPVSTLKEDLWIASKKTAGHDKLNRSFFQVPCVKLAAALLGKKLVRKIGTQRISGKIVETEAYLGIEDKAAHSYQGKRTERTEAMFMTPGTAYVYNIYGIYCCFNISSEGEGCAVLVRALEPLEGISAMHESRAQAKKSPKKKKQKDSDLTNGPSKLCQALQMTKDKCNRVDLTLSDELWLEDGDDVAPDQIVQCPRINIGYAAEWVDKPLRFYVKENACVSVKFKG